MRLSTLRTPAPKSPANVAVHVRQLASQHMGNELWDRHRDRFDELVLTWLGIADLPAIVGHDCRCMAYAMRKVCPTTSTDSASKPFSSSSPPETVGVMAKVSATSSA